MYSVLVVSTFQLVREAVSVLIERDRSFRVIAEVDDHRHPLGVLGDLHPDLILFDLDPDYAAGVETMRQLIRDRPRARIIALTSHVEDFIIENVLRAGVSGLLTKSGPSDDFAFALEAVAQGEAYLSPRIATRLIDWVKNRALIRMPIPALASLTAREELVLRLLAEGRTSKEISSALNLAVETIRSYRKSLMKKLGLHSVAELVQFAAIAGLIPIEKTKEHQ